MSGSPRFPTPRRALFTANIMSAMDAPRGMFIDRRVATSGLLTGLAVEPLLTPPLPSSSPGPMDMDMSPLPHKMPFVSQTEIASPTPAQTPELAEEEDSMLLDSPLPLSRQASLEVLKPAITEYVPRATTV